MVKIVILLVLLTVLHLSLPARADWQPGVIRYSGDWTNGIEGSVDTNSDESGASFVGVYSNAPPRSYWEAGRDLRWTFDWVEPGLPNPPHIGFALSVTAATSRFASATGSFGGAIASASDSDGSDYAEDLQDLPDVDIVSPIQISYSFAQSWTLNALHFTEGPTVSATVTFGINIR